VLLIARHMGVETELQCKPERLANPRDMHKPLAEGSRRIQNGSLQTLAVRSRTEALSLWS
jgi:hypothetical protein